MNIIFSISKGFCPQIECDAQKLKKLFLPIDVEMTESEEYGQKIFRVSCDSKNEKRARKMITDFLVNVYCVNLKRDYLYKNLDFSLNEENMRVLIETLVAFDRESDKRYVKRILKIDDGFSVDGFFNFRLKELIVRWQSVVQITKENSVLLSDDDSFNLLLRFLLSTVKPKHDKVEIYECADGYKVIAGQEREDVVLSESELMLKLVDIAPIEISCVRKLRNGELFCKLCDIFDVVEDNGVYGFS